MEQTQHARRPMARYKPDISLGNILTILSMFGGVLLIGAGVLIWGVRLESMVTSEKDLNEKETRIVHMRIDKVEQQVSQQRADMDKALGEIKSEIRIGFNRLEEKLDKKADKR
jgi:hypothetical protein